MALTVFGSSIWNLFHLRMHPSMSPATDVKRIHMHEFHKERALPSSQSQVKKKSILYYTSIECAIQKYRTFWKAPTPSRFVWLSNVKKTHHIPHQTAKSSFLEASTSGTKAFAITFCLRTIHGFTASKQLQLPSNVPNMLQAPSIPQPMDSQFNVLFLGRFTQAQSPGQTSMLLNMP